MYELILDNINPLFNPCKRAAIKEHQTKDLWADSKGELSDLVAVIKQQQNSLKIGCYGQQVDCPKTVVKTVC
jgi:hypothetical protein